MVRQAGERNMYDLMRNEFCCLHMKNIAYATVRHFQSLHEIAHRA